MPVYDVVKPFGKFTPPGTVSGDELKDAGCDIAWLVKAGAIREVGFLSVGGPMNESEAAAQIGALHDKVIKLEDERDALTQELRAERAKVRVLETGHKEGSKMLADARAQITGLEAELKHYREKYGREPAPRGEEEKKDGAA